MTRSCSYKHHNKPLRGVNKLTVRQTDKYTDIPNERTQTDYNTYQSAEKLLPAEKNNSLVCTARAVIAVGVRQPINDDINPVIGGSSSNRNATIATAVDKTL